MARKGNKQKNGVDSLPRQKMRGADAQAATRVNVTKAKVFPKDNLPKDNLPNCDRVGDQFIGSMTENHSTADVNQIGERTKTYMNSKKHDIDGVRGSESPGDHSGEGTKDASSAETLDLTEEKESLGNVFSGFKDSYDNFSTALKGHVGNLMENIHISDNGIVQMVRRAAPSMMKLAGEWLEKRRPLFISVKTRISGACDFAWLKIELAYPVVLKWLAQLGNIMLLLTMIWLDCTLRGLDSFFRMGTTSFFSFVWCAVFSVVAMVGMSKFLLILVSCASFY